MEDSGEAAVEYDLEALSEREVSLTQLLALTHS